MKNIFPLIETKELASLGPEARTDRLAISELDGELKKYFQRTHLQSNQQELIRALILLWHDHQDEAHAIAQEIHSADGSFVHGILHRREPDYGNAKYWFHRVGPHPAFPIIAQRTKEIAVAQTEKNLLAKISPNQIWDPFAFIDACEGAGKLSSGDDLFLRKLQQIEFRVLLEQFCG